jgi:hypothetical protein
MAIEHLSNALIELQLTRASNKFCLLNLKTNYTPTGLFWHQQPQISIYIRAILRQNTEFSAKSSPSIKSEKT